MATGDRAEHEDDRVEAPSGRGGILEQLQTDVVGREVLSSDTRAHDHHREEGRAQQLRRQAARERRGSVHVVRSRAAWIGTGSRAYSIDDLRFNWYMWIDERRSGASAEDQASPRGPCCDPVVYPDVERDQAIRLAEVAKALGDPIRLQLVDVLRKHAGKVCVCELVPLFDIAQPTLSHHLRRLRDAGIVDSARKGLWAYYYVIPEALGSSRRG